MKGLLLAGLCLLVLLGTAFAEFELDGDVYVLHTSDFDEFVNNEDIALVEFYAPWCGHCKNLAPEYAKAATTLKNNDSPVKLVKIDATEEGDLASRFGVTGYPTLKIFRNGVAAEYKGPRDATGIVSFMQKQAAPAITSLKTYADLEKFVADEPAIVFFGDSSAKIYKEFERVSGGQRETYRFAHAADAAVAEAASQKDGTIALIQAKRYSQSPLETAKVEFEGKAGDLLKFIKANIVPLVGELTDDNKVWYDAKDLPLVKVYADLNWVGNSKGANYILNKIRKVAKDHKDKFTFVVSPKSKNQKEIDDFGLPKGEIPFVIVETKKNKKYPSPVLFSPEALQSHLEAYSAGKLESYVKSEPVPASQPEDGPVVVVGKNFEEIVLDPTKDVLLEAYAPWCGHCKTLEPKYKELAQNHKKYRHSLTIAKVDATANDLPANYQVSGFPTIFFIPADKKDQAPIKYDGAREVADFTKWLKGKVSIPLKAAEGEEEEKTEKKAKKEKKEKKDKKGEKEEL